MEPRTSYCGAHISDRTCLFSILVVLLTFMGVLGVAGLGYAAVISGILMGISLIFICACKKQTMLYLKYRWNAANVNNANRGYRREGTSAPITNEASTSTALTPENENSRNAGVIVVQEQAQKEGDQPPGYEAAAHSDRPEYLDPWTYRLCPPPAYPGNTCVV